MNTRILALLLGSAVSAAAVPVTFQVDMNVKVQEGLFDPAADLVDVRGSFNSWTPSLPFTDENGDNIYELIVELPDESIGTDIEYKYVISPEGWESIDNRRFNLQAGEQILDPVYFNNDEVVSLPVNAELRFEVDLNVQTATGRFNPESDEVYVRGNKMGWGDPPAGVKLEEDPERPGVYTGEYQQEALLTGESIEYKYTIWHWNDETGLFETIWEDGGNKVISFDGSELDTDEDTYLEKAVDPTFFNDLSFDEVLEEDTTVTFRVDMNGATQLNGTPFDPTFEGVWVNGNFANWWTWGTFPPEFQMFDDGTSGGDETAGDLIYTLTRVIPKGTSRMLDYKFAIESLDNEDGFADNHVRYINADGAYELPIESFGVMIKETGRDLGSIVISESDADTLTLSWTGGEGIRLQRASELGGEWTNVEGSEGVSTIDVPIEEDGAGFFRLIRD